MRRILLYAALLAAAVMIPVERSDLGKLKPVETIFLYIDGSEIVLETDTGDMGRGESITAAIDNLKDTTSGIVFFDTADYLLIGKGVEQWVPQLEGYLKESVRLCYGERELDICKAASYLSVHKPELTLKKWTMDAQMQILCAQGEHMILK